MRRAPLMRRFGRSRSRAPEFGVPVGFLAGVAGAWLYTLPTSLGGFGVPMPWLAFMPVFFWAATRPRLTAVVATFLLGAAQDLMSGGPTGPWALGFLLGYAAAAFQRDALNGQGVAAAWLAFGFATVAVAFGAYLAGVIALAAVPNVGALFAQAVATILIAPLAGRVFGGLERPGLAQGMVR